MQYIVVWINKRKEKTHFAVSNYCANVTLEVRTTKSVTLSKDRGRGRERKRERKRKREGGKGARHGPHKTPKIIKKNFPLVILFFKKVSYIFFLYFSSPKIYFYIIGPPEVQSLLCSWHWVLKLSRFINVHLQTRFDCQNVL